MKSMAGLCIMFLSLALNVEGQKVYVVEYESLAGWKNLEKQHLPQAGDFYQK